MGTYDYVVHLVGAFSHGIELLLESLSHPAKYKLVVVYNIPAVCMYINFCAVGFPHMYTAREIQTMRHIQSSIHMCAAVSLHRSVYDHLLWLCMQHDIVINRNERVAFSLGFQSVPDEQAKSMLMMFAVVRYSSDVVKIVGKRSKF